MLKHLAVVAALAVALGTAACGDDESGEDGASGDDFIAEVNAICEESTQQVIDSNLALGYSTDPKEQATLAEQNQQVREDSTAELEALEPPEEDAAAYEEFLAAREDIIATGKERIAATKSGDPAEVEKAAEAQQKAGDAEDAAAEELGADLCDGTLPEDDAQAAEDTLREFATTADPATSCEYESEEALTSEPYVEEGFGGIEACEDEQKILEEKPEELAEDIEVSKVTGVDGLAATLEYEDVGGRYDKVPSEATLYYLDGGWRIFSIRTLE